MKESRGKPLLDQIEIILNLCSQNYLEVSKSIKPVITKIGIHPSDEEITHEDDIDMLKSVLKDIFDNYMTNFKRERQEELNLTDEVGEETQGGEDEVDPLKIEDRA